MGLYYNCKKRKHTPLKFKGFTYQDLIKKIFFTGFPFLCPMVNAS